MREKPILFSTEMVKAILVGRKTMTRRVVKPQPPIDAILEQHSQLPNYWMPYTADGKLKNSFQGSHKDDCGIYCPYGQVSDRLWVRETFCWDKWRGGLKPDYKADGFLPSGCIWRPSIFMPRELSRITLDITNVRVERLREINTKRHDEVAKEGWPFGYTGLAIEKAPIELFAEYWDSINAKRGYSWASNPWVWVIEFKRINQ